MLKTLVVAASLAACSAAPLAAWAAPAHLNDSQYLAAVRCQALVASRALGKGDTAALDAMLKSQTAGRPSGLQDRAEGVRAAAVLQAGHAGPTEKAELVAERDGVCQALTGAPTTTASATVPTQTTGAN
ncbi:MAG: hypothetical protein M3T55_09965 [Pseudomonadota bacterium]|nr:hypothetical protein [Pseudomonadota bacterium]